MTVVKVYQNMAGSENGKHLRRMMHRLGARMPLPLGINKHGLGITQRTWQGNRVLANGKQGLGASYDRRSERS